MGSRRLLALVWIGSGYGCRCRLLPGQPAAIGGPCRADPPASGTANGVVFITIEDETGIADLIVWPKSAKAPADPTRRQPIAVQPARDQSAPESLSATSRPAGTRHQPFPAER